MFSFPSLGCKSRTPAPPFRGGAVPCTARSGGGKGKRSGRPRRHSRHQDRRRDRGHREESPRGRGAGSRGSHRGRRGSWRGRAGAGQPSPGRQVRGRGSPGLGAAPTALAAAALRFQQRSVGPGSPAARSGAVAGGWSLLGSEQGLRQLSDGGAGRWFLRAPGLEESPELPDGRLQSTSDRC